VIGAFFKNEEAQQGTAEPLSDAQRETWEELVEFGKRIVSQK